jgi:hypothetical protein
VCRYGEGLARYPSDVAYTVEARSVLVKVCSRIALVYPVESDLQ